jgi:hypothetical protein
MALKTKMQKLCGSTEVRENPSPTKSKKKQAAEKGIFRGLPALVKYRVTQESVRRRSGSFRLLLRLTC